MVIISTTNAVQSSQGGKPLIIHSAFNQAIKSTSASLRQFIAGVTEPKVMPKQNLDKEISPNSEYTGIYIAYPTTSVLKRTYKNHKSMVNDQHTKVGITVKSFRERSHEYRRTFDGEIMFVPLLVMEPKELAIVEKSILSALRSEFATVGRTREWFDTCDREKIIEIIQSTTGQLINAAL